MQAASSSSLCQSSIRTFHIIQHFHIQHLSPIPQPSNHLLMNASHAQPTRSALLLYPRNILLANGVPRAHVFLHAVLEAALFAAGERGARLGDAALEAVFVEFLNQMSEIPLFGEWEGRCLPTSTSMRAFCIAASCCTWRMICILLSSAIVSVM